MASESGWRIVVAITLMGVCGWLIYGAIVGGANAEEQQRPAVERSTTVATARSAKAAPPRARPGHPGLRAKPPRHVPPNTQLGLSLRT